MRHLIIGSGNMGKRHGKILQDLGDSVDYCDIGFKPGSHVQQYDSLLVCTPAETHAQLIRELAPYNKPLFVEKPVFTVPEELEYPGLSMVACNWRWCNCDYDMLRVTCWYPKARFHDLIHFIDRFWQYHKQPSVGLVIHREDGGRITGGRNGDGNYFDIEVWDRPEVKTIANGRPIHENGPCDMFIGQMATWRNVARGLAQSPNPIPKAAERTAWLLNLASRALPQIASA